MPAVASARRVDLAIVDLLPAVCNWQTHASSAKLAPMFSKTIELRGHFIDSLTLPKVLDQIVTRGATFNIVEFKIGQKRVDPSLARIEVTAPTQSWATSSCRSYARAVALLPGALRNRIRDQSVDESRPRRGSSGRARTMARLARHALKT
ncbi:MAG: hypothetical protein DME57_05535 [Verrucomicrobia bacterium]|nr:MAG: hypothetical protein DME57_05535 [Verrucomicrobiota bacterium]